jgi:hypothetical protein
MSGNRDQVHCQLHTALGHRKRVRRDGLRHAGYICHDLRRTIDQLFVVRNQIHHAAFVDMTKLDTHQGRHDVQRGLLGGSSTQPR